MSTYVLMRILESAPRRYDLGIRLLTLGALDKAYDRLATHLRPAQRVLDLGCGTGAFTLRAARNGAHVKGIDTNAQMLEIAARRAADAGLTDNVQFQQTGVANLDREQPAAYDAVTSGLCFSELSDDELAYALKHIERILQPGGLLLVADEVKPQTLPLRLLYTLARAPLAALTYLVAQQTTHPIDGLPAKITRAGLSLESRRLTAMGTLLELVARKPPAKPP